MASLPDPLERAVTEHGLDRVRFDLGSVWDPIPLGVAISLGLTLIWPFLGLGVGRWLHGRVSLDWYPLAVCTGGLLAAGIATLPALLQAWFEVTGLQVEVTAHTLTFVRKTRLGDRRDSIRLADIESIDRSGGRLTLTTSDRRITIPLAGRSRRTQRALDAFLERNRQRATGVGGSTTDVPADLSRLRRAQRELG